MSRSQIRNKVIPTKPNQSTFNRFQLQVFCLALIFSMVCKKTDEDDDGLYDEEEPNLKSDETWMHGGPSPKGKCDYRPIK